MRPVVNEVDWLQLEPIVDGMEVHSSSVKKRNYPKRPQKDLSIQTDTDQLNNELLKKHQKKHKRLLHAMDQSKATFYSLGEFNCKCPYCLAVHFPEEYNKEDASKGFLSCCNYGKLSNLESYIDEYPEEMKLLYDPNFSFFKAFTANIRKVNSSFSFASMSCFNFTFPTPGPPVYKIQGQVYHKMNKVAQPENDDEAPTNGQLFFLDASEAMDYRQTCFKNSDQLMAYIDSYLRENNRFANSYRMMREVYEDHEKEAQNHGTEMPEIKLLFCLKEGFDERRYNLPVADDVFAIMVCNAESDVIPAKYVVNLKGKKELLNIHPLDPIIEPMTYPILYPYGTLGWNNQIKDKVGKKLTLCDFAKFRLHYREDKFFPLHHSKKLFQQWVTDQYTRIEWERLMFFRTDKFQRTFAKTNYQNILDHMDKKSGNKDIEKKMVILPSSFPNSPRNMHEHYMDAMTIMNETGKPDLFITFTCNPQDPDILKCLLPRQIPNDRPDIIARVFKLKKDQLIREIVKDGLFGAVVSNIYVIEYQKRGLPHAHIIITLHPMYKLNNKNKVDKFIHAELPDPVTNPELFHLVTKNMLHGPCNEKSACWKKKKCSKKFPYAFNEETKLDEDDQATYRRSNNGRVFVKNEFAYTNQYVVPYNPYLLIRFGAHINIEKVSSTKAIKYLFKYVFKGLDAATIQCSSVDKDGNSKVMKYDEVSDYLDARCVSPAEACWRIMKYPLQDKSHSVMGLPVHLEGEKIVYFDPTDDPEKIKEKSMKNSPLEAYFEFLKRFPDVIDPKTQDRILYSDMPKFCTWNSSKGEWKYPRGGHKKAFGRLYPVNPKETEKYYLSYMLLNLPGNYKELKTVDDVEYPTFAQAALARGLCKDDNEWRNCLLEARVVKMPYALRNLFITILVHCNPKYPEKLWKEFKDDLSEDIKAKFPNLSADAIHKKALYLIEMELNYQDKSLKDFKTMPQDFDKSGMKIDEDECIDPKEEKKKAEEMFSEMNFEQKGVIEELKPCFEKGVQKCLYIDGPGGTGKSFTLQTIYHFARANGKKVCNMAFSGIAASVLKKGRTLHNTFKLPLDINADSYSGLSDKGIEAEEIKAFDLFVWDEAPMASKYVLKMIDRKLRELMKVNKPFGGKTIVLSGDFRQILPIRRNATRTEIIDLLIKKSPLWKHFIIHNLVKNMRANPGELKFANDLLDIGNGVAGKDGYIQVPDKCITEKNLVQEIFGDIFETKNFADLPNRAILATLNCTVDQYNEEVLQAFPGDFEKPYISIDETDPKSKMPVSIEFLNALQCSSLADHKIRLKKNCIVMLIRNLNVRQGLCNGTRLQVINPGKNLLQCIILNGDRAGDTVFIPRITLIEDKKFPFSLRRHQFPIKHAFCFTINKSQSQTFKKIGIDFQNEVFAHGMCYVALSRAQSWDGIKIKLDPENEEKKIRNIVWQEVFF